MVWLEYQIDSERFRSNIQIPYTVFMTHFQFPPGFVPDFQRSKNLLNTWRKGTSFIHYCAVLCSIYTSSAALLCCTDETWSGLRWVRQDKIRQALTSDAPLITRNIVLI